LLVAREVYFFTRWFVNRILLMLEGFTESPKVAEFAMNHGFVKSSRAAVG
jgi:hypothetical protein